MQTGTRLKLDLYILSLWLLFFLLFVNKVRVPLDTITCHRILSENWIAIMCLSGMAYGGYAFWQFKHRVIGSSKQGPWEIVDIDHISFENLSFLATYIVPLLCFDLDFHLDEGRNALMLLLVLVAIGAVYIKANLYYTNPSLALMNFKIYRVTYRYQDESKKCIVLSRDALRRSDKIFARIIDENIYYVRKAK